MLRRAKDLTARARERIRAAREHDPHAWPEHDDDGRSSATTIPSRSTSSDPETTTSRATAATADRPLGSPEPGAPDVDDAVGPAGSAARRRGAARTGRGSAPAGCMTGAGRDAPPEAGVPNGLRTAAAWSWRFIVVIAGFYVLLYAAALRRGGRRPGDRRAAAGGAAAAGRGLPRPARLAALAGRVHHAGRRPGRRRRDHHPGRRAVLGRLQRPGQAGQPGHRAGAGLRRPHVPDHQGAARRTPSASSSRAWSTTRAPSPPAP